MNTMPFNQVICQWHRQIGCRLRRSPRVEPRGIGAMGLMADANNESHFVEIDRLLVLLVHDEEFAPGRTAVRLSGFRASRVEHGVVWGGPSNAHLLKDLALTPRLHARGLRVDYNTDARLLELALRLDRRINQALRFQPRVSRRPLRLPRLWAGYPPRQADDLFGKGPEFKGLCQRFGIRPDSLFQKFRRDHQGLVLYPLDFLADQLNAAVAVFADLEHFPQCHAFGLGNDCAGLKGYTGASAIDFVATDSACVQPRNSRSKAVGWSNSARSRAAKRAATLSRKLISLDRPAISLAEGNAE